MTEPRYVEEIIRKARKDGAGQITEVDVLHDDWCDLLNGKGQCNCDPIVSFPKPN